MIQKLNKLIVIDEAGRWFPKYQCDCGNYTYNKVKKCDDCILKKAISGVLRC